jgi:glycosyltransferase involved in cell wall biosynthesis
MEQDRLRDEEGKVMRILMHIRPDWREHPGGDVVQLQRWAFWLQEFGVQVILSAEEQPDLHGIDLVHLHNVGRAYSLLATLEHCHRRRVPTVLTTLYWPEEDFERFGRPGLTGWLFGLLPSSLRERLKSALRWKRQPGQRSGLWREFWQGRRNLLRHVVQLAHGLIAVSTMEVEALKQLLPEAPVIYVVPSGVDAFYWSDDPQLWRREQQWLHPDGTVTLPAPPSAEELQQASRPVLRRGVLCVGRFDPQKGQHRLIRALKPLDIPLTLVGPDNPNYPGYRRYCQKQAYSRVTILPPQSQAELCWLYRSATVHAQASWSELSSLSALEAACCGAHIVTTKRGGMQDYFGPLAWYADPGNDRDLRHAVAQALAEPQTADLSRHVRSRFTWRQSATTLRQVYELVLAHQKLARHAA